MWNEKKSKQLGMPIGTATGKLRKTILFDCLVQLKKNICFQCKETINNSNDLSIEHKEPWLDSDDPVNKFFDLDNIAFSHLHCNIRAGRKDRGIRTAKHGTNYMYERYSCKCLDCKKAHAICSLNYKRERRLKEG